MKTFVAAAAAALVLAACGGGGGSQAIIGAGATTDPLVMAAGSTAVVPGTVSTDGITLTSAAWTVSASAESAAALTLSNDKCTVATKTDFAPVAGGGSSTWQCDLTVTAPASLAIDATYTLTLTGTDARNLTHSVSRTLRVTGNPSIDPTAYAAAAGAAFTVDPGQLGSLHCAMPDARWYQWAVADSSGTNVKLTQTSGSDVFFTAPVVAADTPLTFECRGAVNDRVYTSRVTATVPAATTDTLVVSASGPSVVPFGVSSFGMTFQWVSAQGVQVSGPTPTITWAVPGAVPAGVSLLAGGPTLTANVGTSTLPSFLPLRVVGTSGTATSEARLTAIIDPVDADKYVPPSVSPGAQTVMPGDTVKVSVSGAPYAQWAVVSGPSVLLGGQSTPSVSFIAPAVSVASDIVLRAAVSYGPQSAQAPVAGFVDAVVHVAP